MNHTAMVRHENGITYVSGNGYSDITVTTEVYNKLSAAWNLHQHYIYDKERVGVKAVKYSPDDSVAVLPFAGRIGRSLPKEAPEPNAQ